MSIPSQNMERNFGQRYILQMIGYEAQINDY